MSSHQLIQESIKTTQLNIQKAVNSFSTLSDNQLNWKPSSDSWSVGECLSHLINSNRLYFIKFQSIFKTNNCTEAIDFPYAQTFAGKMITKGVDPANIKKTKTFKPFFPDVSKIKKNILDDYTNSSNEFITLANKMKCLDLKKIKLSSPVNILLRMNLGDPLIFIPKHDERHLNQAERVKNHKHFPNQ